MGNGILHDAYPVFIVYKELEARNAIPDHLGNDLDLIWSHCVEIYEGFVKSEENDHDRSEYDCIVAYLKKRL